MIVADIYNSFRAHVTDTLTAQDVRVVQTTDGQSLTIDGPTVQFDFGDFTFSELDEFSARSVSQKNHDNPRGHADGTFTINVYAANREQLMTFAETVFAAVNTYNPDDPEQVFLHPGSFTRPETDATDESTPLFRILTVNVSILTDAQWR